MEDEPETSGGAPEAPAGQGGEIQPEIMDPEAVRLKNQYDELNERFLRLAADFDNFRKRAVREQDRIIRQANEAFAVDILEIMDNLDRAGRADDAHLREGLEQIRCLFTAILERHGITPIDSCEKPFDPAKHEAIAHVPSDRDEGIVIDEVSRGYQMQDRVIRFAKVAVSKGKRSQTTGEV